MLSVQGAGWGGGSLIYANMFARPLRVYDLVGNVWEWCRTAGSSGLHELKGSAWTSAFSRGNPVAFNDANDFMQDDDTGFSCVSNDADAL
jgi:formylglycine-generating enzyme required for sulfatase activity